jgi:hypothetical protein
VGDALVLAVRRPTALLFANTVPFRKALIGEKELPGNGKITRAAQRILRVKEWRSE